MFTIDRFIREECGPHMKSGRKPPYGESSFDACPSPTRSSGSSDADAGQES